MATNPRAAAKAKAADPSDLEAAENVPADVHGELVAVEEVGPPEPTAVSAVWFPAIVTIPGLPPQGKAKVYTTPQGVYVYFKVPEDRADWTPQWWAPIDFEKTPRKPLTGHAARHGVQIHTAAGLLRITQDAGCGCHWPLKRWSPEFANRMVAWQ